MFDFQSGSGTQSCLRPGLSVEVYQQIIHRWKIVLCASEKATEDGPGRVMNLASISFF
jgi:hypothetical protein